MSTKRDTQDKINACELKIRKLATKFLELSAELTKATREAAALSPKMKKHSYGGTNACWHTLHGVIYDASGTYRRADAAFDQAIKEFNEAEPSDDGKDIPL